MKLGRVDTSAPVRVTLFDGSDRTLKTVRGFGPKQLEQEMSKAALLPTTDGGFVNAAAIATARFQNDEPTP